jgi:hypothetical protein
MIRSSTKRTAFTDIGDYYRYTGHAARVHKYKVLKETHNIRRVNLARLVGTRGYLSLIPAKTWTDLVIRLHVVSLIISVVWVEIVPSMGASSSSEASPVRENTCLSIINNVADIGKILVLTHPSDGLLRLQC